SGTLVLDGSTPAAVSVPPNGVAFEVDDGLVVAAAASGTPVIPTTNVNSPGGLAFATNDQIAHGAELAAEGAFFALSATAQALHGMLLMGFLAMGYKDPSGVHASTLTTGYFNVDGGEVTMLVAGGTSGVNVDQIRSNTVILDGAVLDVVFQGDVTPGATVKLI